MKLDRFTRICINIVLILVIALLLKSLVTVPKNVYAKPGFEYKAIESLFNEREKMLKELGEKKYREVAMKSGDYWIDPILNWYAKKGWKLHTFIAQEVDGYIVDNAFVILER